MTVALRRTTLRTTLTLFALAIVSAADTSAQTVTVPIRVKVGCAFDLKDAVKDLTRHYLKGDGNALRTHAAALLKATETCPEIKNTAITKHDVLILLWVDADPLGGEQVVYRAIVQKGDVDPFGTVLPGVGRSTRTFELFVSVKPQDAIATTYTSTRERNPIEELLPAFAQAIFDPLTALLAATQRIPPSAPRGANPHYATVSQVVLPFTRAAVHVEIRVAQPPQQGGFEKAIATLSATNQFITAAHSLCGQNLDTALRQLSEKAASCTAVPTTCIDNLKDPFEKAHQTALSKCTTDGERADLLAVEASYRDLVANIANTEVKAAFDLKNAPRKLVSLGLLSAYAFTGGVVDGARVKVDDGNLVADPLDRRLSLVVVNFGFKPYNAEAFHPTGAERFKWFAGAVVTPDFGAAIGVSALIARGLSANFGGAIIGVRGLHSDDQLGNPPTHDTDPYKMSSARVLFAGVGYNFK
jgi:hypothetical protein